MNIFVNQLGYLPHSKKNAVIAEIAADKSATGFAAPRVRIYDANGDCRFETTASVFGFDEASGDFVWQVDFSELTAPGTYTLHCDSCISHSFTVGEKLYGSLTRLLSKALYFQRCGSVLPAVHAGLFSRTACHLRSSFLWEEYKEYLSGRLEKKNLQQFPIHGGWHDAGDFGRYPTAASVALAHILYAYRFFPDAFTETLQLPESGNFLPDILNECRYELCWLLQMQAADGGVYHKQTTLQHADFILPAEDNAALLLFPVSSMAVADFAGVMALASRIYRPFDETFAQQTFLAAKRAYDWLDRHPEFVPFFNPPECNTGEYNDYSDKDERMWAAIELYRCTGEDIYLQTAKTYFDEISVPTEFGWANVSGFASWALLENALVETTAATDALPFSPLAQDFCNALSTAIVREADRVLSLSNACGYGVALSPEDYVWGSNMVVLNRAMLLGTAYLLTQNASYYDGVIRQMDYILGVNAVDYSYITGVGAHAFCHPHNRVTEADGVMETIPGFVSGGPNGHPADETAISMLPSGTPPMKCFLDRMECYSLNEITIYWNSPAIFTAAFLDCSR